MVGVSWCRGVLKNSNRDTCLKIYFVIIFEKMATHHLPHTQVCLVLEHPLYYQCTSRCHPGALTGFWAQTEPQRWCSMIFCLISSIWGISMYDNFCCVALNSLFLFSSFTSPCFFPCAAQTTILFLPTELLCVWNGNAFTLTGVFSVVRVPVPASGRPRLHCDAMKPKVQFKL